MTVTKEDIDRVHEKLDGTIKEFSSSLTGLTMQLADQTREISLLVQSLTHNEVTFQRLERNQTSQGKQIATNTIDIRELRTKQSGILDVLQKIAYPFIIAGLSTYLVMGKP